MKKYAIYSFLFHKFYILGPILKGFCESKIQNLKIIEIRIGKIQCNHKACASYLYRKKKIHLNICGLLQKYILNEDLFTWFTRYNQHSSTMALIATTETNSISDQSLSLGGSYLGLKGQSSSKEPLVLNPPLMDEEVCLMSMKNSSSSYSVNGFTYKKDRIT